ncbi:MAG: DNA polymerase III subunit delta [Gammaproteobacteria bacterium]
MKIKAEQLARTLQQDLHPLYWLSGDEPLLMQEAADSIRQRCRELGFVAREIVYIERSFNWDSFKQVTGNLSLFADKKIVELRLASAKLDDGGKTALQDYVNDASDDIVILISSPRLESGSLNTKWFKQLEAASVIIQIWPVGREHLGSWLSARLLQEGINADAEALQLLSDKVEGNLLAAMQEIEKLKLLAHTGAGEIKLDARTVMQVVADSSRFNIYQLVDAALAGQVSRAQKILAGLRNEGSFPLPILGAITRELRSLLPMLEKKQQGIGTNQIIQQARVWFNRKQAVSRAVNTLSQEQVWDMLEHARLIDRCVKGLAPNNPWTELSLLLLGLSGTETATTRARIGQA